jgi:hypothetical protein
MLFIIGGKEVSPLLSDKKDDTGKGEGCAG